MPATRRRRILRSTPMALAGVALLLSGYVFGYLWLEWLSGREAIDPALYGTLSETVFAPLRLYEDSDFPGGRTLGDLVFNCRESGYESQFKE